MSATTAKTPPGPLSRFAAKAVWWVASWMIVSALMYHACWLPVPAVASYSSTRLVVGE